MDLPTRTAAPTENATATLALQGSAHRTDEKMLYLALEHASTRSVFMVPLDQARRLRDQIDYALGVAGITDEEWDRAMETKDR